MLPDNNLNNYVRYLAEKAQDESHIFPVDREFLAKYLDEIMSFDSLDFLYYNMEMVNDTYVNQLLVCLPELWSNISIDDLIEICKLFTNVYSYLTLIKFTYKYVEIDILKIILEIAREKSISYFEQIKEYLRNQWNVLVKSESDFEDFENSFLNIDYEEWRYIKQRLLIDKRVKPALLSFSETKLYIYKILDENNESTAI